MGTQHTQDIVNEIGMSQVLGKQHGLYFREKAPVIKMNRLRKENKREIDNLQD